MEAIVVDGHANYAEGIVGKVGVWMAAGVNSLSSHLGNWSKVESLPENNSPKMIFFSNHNFSAIS